jgi:hypothetical protein
MHLGQMQLSGKKDAIRLCQTNLLNLILHEKALKNHPNNLSNGSNLL